MARSNRILLDNVPYHIVMRGNQQQTVFYDDEDRTKYLHFLLKYKSLYAGYLYAYCLMKNHVHLALQTIDKYKLPKLMQGLNQSYTIWFNSKYKKTGHLWESRYKNYVLYDEKYLEKCITYIENNPVRAEIVNHPKDYQWSSYRGRNTDYCDILLDDINFSM